MNFVAVAKYKKDQLKAAYESMKAILNDPYLIVEGMVQSGNDTVEYKGVEYAIGYIGFDVALEILLTKGVGKISKIDEIVEGFDDISDVGKAISKSGSDIPTQIHHGLTNKHSTYTPKF